MNTDIAKMIELQERLHTVKRIKRAAQKDGATLEDIMAAIEQEEQDINEMLYQNPSLSNE